MFEFMIVLTIQFYNFDLPQHNFYRLIIILNKMSWEFKCKDYSDVFKHLLFLVLIFFFIWLFFLLSVVLVGGDGHYMEFMNGLVIRIQEENGVDVNNPDSKLVPPNVRIGIIPAGNVHRSKMIKQKFFNLKFLQIWWFILFIYFYIALFASYL